jgi:hypothetical protein
LRSAESLGGFATVLKKGEREGGTILAILAERGANARVFERMPALDGARKWSCIKTHDVDNPNEFQEYLDRRGRQDPDLWIIELDVANGERLIS